MPSQPINASPADAPQRSHLLDTRSVALLDIDPDLGDALDDRRRAEARGRLMVRVVRLSRGVWNTRRLTALRSGYLGLLVVDGVLARELLATDVISMELLGPGDILRPWQDVERGDLLRSERRWSVLADARLALLDAEVAARLAR
jgi:CRP/FNR family cyclic AMP-dependent transcriptional regulator